MGGADLLVSPSGHIAADLSFVFGAAQERPAAVIPLSIVTLGSHWSLLRTRKHYPSDIVPGAQSHSPSAPPLGSSDLRIPGTAIPPSAGDGP
jgi:hypothetical protein